MNKELVVSPVATPARISQTTAVEQSRAVAEVLAAVQVAQQAPRSLTAAVTAMEESCRQPGLAERAFYRYSRGGSAITGPSVHLARELARCWGNFQHGIGELHRQDDHSEMLAWAWDVQTNTRSSNTFIVPHKRDKKGGPEPLVDLRDIYENNANAAARRLREAIFSMLPPWFVERAKELCTTTLKDGGGKPLAQRVADAVKMFQVFGVAAEQLEHKLARKRDAWNELDVAQLGVVFKSLQRGEVTVDEEFPPPVVTAAELPPPTPPPSPVVDTAQAEGWPETAKVPGGEN